MNGIDLISYRARESAGGMAVSQAATTIADQREAGRWRERLEPWLRMGDPRGCAYLDFGSQAALIRWQGDIGSSLAWDRAVVLAGPSARLTGTYVLELPELAAAWPSPDGTGVPPADGTPGPRRAAIEARARAADVITSIIPALAHALQGAHRVTMPRSEPGRSEAVLWGLVTLLRMIGDPRPVSFLSYASGTGRDEEMPGLLVSFRPAAVALPPDPGFAALAADLAGRFAADPAGLRRVLTEHGVSAAADVNVRISRLLALPPRIQPGNVYRREAATVTASFGDPAAPAAGPAAPVVRCPICLGYIPNWGALDYWRWDASVGDGDYVRIDIPPDLNPTQRARFTHGAYVRCPASTDVTTVAHYLPARYGSFGDPVLLGFVGLTQSGKTHLLASMIGEIEGLSEYGVDISPLDRATHHDFLERSVRPLIMGHRVLPGTPDDASTTLTDAFIVRQRSGPERVVALFDVSGGDLVRRDSTKEFLWIADGLFFIIDPDHIRGSKVGNDAFSNVLDVIEERPEAGPASAAIVLNKADKARFDEPIARWLRAGDGTLDPTEFLRESADVYAYLEQHHAIALTKPYQACQKATLHVASPTGGAEEDVDKTSTYPRGVTPLRVLRPLVAMLAMTGVLTGPEAERVGI
jgi:hypothetical protein